MEDYYYISKAGLIIGGILLLILLIYLWFVVDKLKEDRKERDAKISSYQLMINERETNLKKYEHLTETQKLEFQKNEANIKLQSQDWAIKELEKFKASELEAIKKVFEKNAVDAALNLLQQWKSENEARIRQDAANRSYSVNLGKITEHLVPFHANFPFNPKDARFIGSPIDLVVFDGLSDERDDLVIYFLEIKTGKSALSKRQKAIKSAVQKREVIWHEINTDDI